MAHLLIADGHFVGADGEQQRFAALLREAEQQGVREISILGDFLELWIGLPGLETPWQEALLAPLQRLKESGVRLRYIEGNKDYSIRSWNRRYGLFDEVVLRDCLVDSPVGLLYLAHGDLVNTADRQYRLWRWLSRSWLFAGLMRMLPRRLLARLSYNVAERMKASNRYHKSYFPEAQLRAAADRARHGAKWLLFGHFHSYQRLEQAGRTVVTLPFLGEEYAGVWIDRDGVRRFGVEMLQ